MTHRPMPTAAQIYDAHLSADKTKPRSEPYGIGMIQRMQAMQHESDKLTSPYLVGTVEYDAWLMGVTDGGILYTRVREAYWRSTTAATISGVKR